MVPKQKRREILDTGHRGLIGGHFSHKCMTFYVAGDDPGHYMVL